jgi:hypothetical protein
VIVFSILLLSKYYPKAFDLSGIYSVSMPSTNKIEDSWTIKWARDSNIFILLASSIAISIPISAILIFFNYERAPEKSYLDTRIENANKLILEKPEKVQPVWDFSRLVLEQYYNRNLTQINSIYKFSMIAFFAGFFLILATIVFNLANPSKDNATFLPISAGIITEIIAATFLYLYKTTVIQAMHYTKSLEKMNRVGMVMAILDTISSDSTAENLKDLTKTKVILSIMESQSSDTLGFDVLEQKEKPS